MPRIPKRIPLDIAKKHMTPAEYERMMAEEFGSATSRGRTIKLKPSQLEIALDLIADPMAASKQWFTVVPVVRTMFADDVRLRNKALKIAKGMLATLYATGNEAAYSASNGTGVINEVPGRKKPGRKPRTASTPGPKPRRRRAAVAV